MVLRTGHCYVRDKFCCLIGSNKMVKSYHSELFNILDMPDELELKQKTNTQINHLPFQNCHIKTLRTGQSGVTDFFFSHSESHFTITWLLSP